MSLFKKKPKKLFGTHIAPDCGYCFHNAGEAGQIHCSLCLHLQDGRCKKFVYNPLMRTPKAAPAFHKDYKPEDFSL